MSEAKRASLVFPVNSNVIFIREIGLVVIARPMEAIDDIIAHETVIADDGGVVGMIDFEGYTRSATVVLDHRDAVVNGRLVMAFGDGDEEVIEIVFGRDASPYVCERGAIDGGGEVGELVDDLTVGVERVDIIPISAHAVVEMHVHDAGGFGGDGLQEQFAGRLNLIRIDHEGIYPVIRPGFEVGEELVYLTILQAVARERRDAELAIFEQVIPPLDVLGIGGVHREGHELLLVVHGVDTFPRGLAGYEVIRVLVGRESALNITRRDRIRRDLNRYVLGCPTGVGVAGER